MPLNSQLLAEFSFEVTDSGLFKDTDVLPNLKSYASATLS